VRARGRPFLAAGVDTFAINEYDTVMSDNSRRYSDKDPAGAMVGGMIMLLDYAASIRGGQVPPRKAKGWIDMVTNKMREVDLLHAEEAEGDCRKLEDIVKTRGKVELGTRELAYFGSIFYPYTVLIKIAIRNYRDGPGQDDPNPDAVPLSSNILRMLPAAAHELLALQYLLEPSSEWNESHIFYGAHVNGPTCAHLNGAIR